MAPLWGFFRALPLERAVRVGAAVGSLAMGFDRGNRPIAMRNLKIAFPEMDEAARLVILRDTYRNFGRMAAEWVHFYELNPGNIERYVNYAGLEHWEAAKRLSNGRGILILTGHYGNFELLSLSHSIHGNQVAIVQRPNRNPVIDRAVDARRTSNGNRTIARKGAGREVLRLLRKDWMVAVPLDLDVRHGVFVDFFGLPASTSDALARIAMATRTPVVPAFMERDGTSTRHTIRFLPYIEAVRDGSRSVDGNAESASVEPNATRTADRDEKVRQYTQQFTSVIESMIRLHPDHWNWIHRRWKTRPPGESRFY